MSDVLLSVVVPSFNSAEFIEECLKSIEREYEEGVEFILVDGASQDETMEICGRYAHLFSRMISEPDRGQSEAFNKGFSVARGRFLTWLNSDDVLCAGVMRTVLTRLKKTDKEWLVANCVFIDEEGLIKRCCRSGGYESFAVKRGVLNVFGPSTFFEKRLYDELGSIDESFHYSMDTEYWWRIAASKRTYERINCYFWGFRLHSASKTSSTILTREWSPEMRKEAERIRKRYCPHSTPTKRKRAVLMARIWRSINLTYLKGLFDTVRYKGKPVGKLEQRKV